MITDSFETIEEVVEYLNEKYPNRERSEVVSGIYTTPEGDEIRVALGLRWRVHITSNRVCGNCQYAQAFTYPPGPGGEREGVRCISKKLAAELTDELNDIKGDLERDGFINLWRVEAFTECENNCPGWKHWGGK